MLRQISQRVLWLSAAIVDAANRGRPNSTGIKVGGHQASSASMVDIMVALWFHELTALDRVSVKPHASPVLHAINYLLGDLDPAYLPTLRAKGGLQCYPSRIKDPDTVDFSTGSVGIGATAAAVGGDRAPLHRAPSSPTRRRPGRFISLLGDAELDEGAIWEAVADPQVAQPRRAAVGRRPQPAVPGPGGPRHPDRSGCRACSSAAGWQVVTLKWGRLISELFERPGGDELRRRLEEMPNEEYQRMLRVDSAEVAGPDPGRRRGQPSCARWSTPCRPTQLAAAVRDLGGHDLGLLIDTFGAADTHRPTVVFAYTVKGRGLPTEGHPNNHSALLTEAQMQALADASGTSTRATRGHRFAGRRRRRRCARDARRRAAPCAGADVARRVAVPTDARAPAPQAASRPRPRSAACSPT